MSFIRAAVEDVAHAAVHDDLRDDVGAQGAEDVLARGEGGAPEVQGLVGGHLNEGKNLLATRDEAGAKQMVDALGPGGRHARRVARAVGEGEPELLVVEDDSIPVVGDHTSGSGPLTDLAA